MYKAKKPKTSTTEIVTLTQLEEKHEMSERTVLDRDLFAVLVNIQEKLNSPVFNGGFERLVSSVEDIKTSQQKTEEHITTINKTIYEPDEGLFSRIKSAEKKQEQETGVLLNKISGLSVRLESLEKFQANVHKALWWLIPAAIVGICKVIWDLLKDHIILK